MAEMIGPFWVDPRGGLFVERSGDRVSFGATELAASVLTAVGGAGAITGPAGADGAPGAAGPPGEQGPKGDTGATGARGAAGADGRDGATGRAGAMGARGMRGLPGDVGRAVGVGVARPAYGGVPDFSSPYAEQGRRVVILHAWRTAERDLIRSIEPGALILMYRNLTRCARPVETSTPWGARAATGLTLAEATAGGWASAVADADAGVDAVIARIDRSGYAAAWVAAVLAVVAETGGGWDGVFLDDMNATGDGYLSDGAWQTAQQALNAVVGPALRAAGLLAIPNMSGTWGQQAAFCTPQLRYFDGGYDEYHAMWPGGNREQGYAQAGDSTAAQAACLAQKKIHIAASPVTDARDEAGALYAFHMALLGTDQSSRSSWSAWVSGYDAPSLIPSGLPDAARLGLPLGAAERSGSGWRRAFQSGVVRVNSSRSTATIDGVSLAAFTGAIEWRSSTMPTGGTAGQLLAKNTAADFDAGWVAAPVADAAAGTSSMRRLGTGATEAAPGANAVARVAHGATAGTARPTGYALVVWIGSVQPTNWATGDIWVRTS